MGTTWTLLQLTMRRSQCVRELTVILKSVRKLFLHWGRPTHLTLTSTRSSETPRARATYFDVNRRTSTCYSTCECRPFIWVTGTRRA
jgi:hypothetical protein